MDAKKQQLEAELSKHLQAASDVACQLQLLEQGPGTPHYDSIELAAHEVGKRLSRQVQQDRLADVSGQQSQTARCPDCQAECSVETQRREVTSMDGRVELIETVAHCRHCRRSFFPSADSVGT